MAQNTDLQQLLGRAKNGDQAAFRVIFEAQSDRLFNYALSRTHDREAALDITQETFIALWRALPSFTYKGIESFMGFIFIIHKRGLAKHYEQQKHEQEKYGKYSEEELYEEQHEDYRHLFGALDKISPHYREAINLRYFGSLSFAEVGHAMGIKEDAARVLHHRAIKKLQEEF